ncbi:hypothetical protein AWB82_05633 [Caballeronia glebae]|uniref:Phasin n=1 Tax=Caballeronia glebae TaxID=1777143 RepID=A0A158CQS9_9BURK|nr:hypothetical protein [Caballeronia glebae]SAK83957.1 hypothetical protein AWB82_05633 [Caballeronia glebae]
MTSKTTQDSTSETTQPTFKKIIDVFKTPRLDWTAMAESHRKDIDALLQANRDAYEGIHAIAERRNALLMEELTQWNDMFKSAIDPQAIKQRAEIGQNSLARVMQGVRELIELEGSVRNRTWKVLQDRVQERVANLQASLQPKQPS